MIFFKKFFYFTFFLLDIILNKLQIKIQVDFAIKTYFLRQLCKFYCVYMLLFIDACNFTVNRVLIYWEVCIFDYCLN